MTDYDDEQYRERKSNRSRSNRNARRKPRGSNPREGQPRDRSRSHEARKESAESRNKRHRGRAHVSSAARKAPMPEAPKALVKSLKNQAQEDRKNPYYKSRNKRPARVVPDLPEKVPYVSPEPAPKFTFEKAHKPGDCPHRTGYCGGDLAWEFSDDEGKIEYRCEGYLRTLDWDF